MTSTEDTCAITDCDGEATHRGWCNKHYTRWRRHGDPERPPRGTIEERFWAKVNVATSDECWMWEGTVGIGKWNEYGRFKYGGRVRRSHRVAWQLMFGDIPEGMFVCHHCDTPLCVNPSHLFLGTPADNMADMVKKRRTGRRENAGSNNPSSKLTESEVDMIRVDSRSPKAIAEHYGVSRSTVYNIRNGHVWKRLGDDR